MHLRVTHAMAVRLKELSEMQNKQLPTSIDEAAELLERQMLESEKAEIVAIDDERNLQKLHFSLGLFVRNHFDLWSDNSELMKNAGWWADPDEISHQIIVSLWRKLRANQKV